MDHYLDLPKFVDRPDPLRKRVFRRKWTWTFLFVFVTVAVVHFRHSLSDFYTVYVPKHQVFRGTGSEFADSQQEQLGYGYNGEEGNEFAKAGDQGGQPKPASFKSDSKAMSDSNPISDSKPLSDPKSEPVPDDIPIDHTNPRSRLDPEFAQHLEWEPPIDRLPEGLHGSPHYDRYAERDHDPNRWEAFPQNMEFYTNSTIDRSKPNMTAEPFSPFPDYNSAAWSKKWKGKFFPCRSLTGKFFNESDDEIVKGYKRGTHVTIPPDHGSYEALGIDETRCYDRVSQLGVVGGSEAPSVHLMDDLTLGELQNECLARNQDRFEFPSTPDIRPGLQLVPRPEPELQNVPRDAPQGHQETPTEPQFKQRSAVVIRAWEGYEYGDNDIHSIRSLVSDLSLQSGGEYQVFLLVEIKEVAADMFADPAWYDEKMEHIPTELQDMTILWNEKLTRDLYPGIGQYEVQVAQYLSVQWFLETHPEFDYVWNWEMDVRYFGQIYHTLERLAEFSKAQPRKYMWERNARFYFPGNHGSYKEFFDATNNDIATSSYTTNPIWGQWHFDEEGILGPNPPRSQEEDNFEWGVGEEADFITMLPIWDPRHTLWGWKNAIKHYPDPFVETPRRSYIITNARFSRRLLHAMHQENMKGRILAAEMMPSTVALEHGLKAIYAPMPVWFSHVWPDVYVDGVFNADGWGAGSFYNTSEYGEDEPGRELAHPSWGRGVDYNEDLARQGLPQAGTGPNNEGARARWGQEHDSIYNVDREHNFLGWSWYYRTDFARMVYWRWLGWKATYSDRTQGWDPDYDKTIDIGSPEWEEKNGRLCFPAMMLHPIKDAKPGKIKIDVPLEDWPKQHH